MKYIGLLLFSAMLLPITSCSLIIGGIKGLTDSIQDKWNSNHGINFFSNDWERLYNTGLEYEYAARLYVFSTNGTSVKERYLVTEKNSDFEERWDHWINYIEKQQTISDEYDFSFDDDYQWMWYVLKKSYLDDPEFVKEIYYSSLLAAYVPSTERIYVIQIIS